MKLRVMSAAFLMGAASYIAMIGPAAAADLGGDCCSDLEERVAELEATTARKGNRRVSLQISGQVTTGVLAFDNGDQSDAYITDFGPDSSRFRLKGSAKINPNMSAGFVIEVSTLSARADQVTETKDEGADTGDGAVALRLANWYLEHKHYGRLTVGRLNMVSDGISEIDLGGTNIVARNGLYVGNSIAFGGGSGFTIGNFFPGTDFEFDRNNAVRYDTPTFGGFTVGTSWGENDRWDIGLRYAGEHAGFRIAGGIAYGYDSDNTVLDQAIPGNTAESIQGSLSVLHVGTGLFASGSFAHREFDIGSIEQDYWSVRGGITKNWFGIGKTALYGEYHKSDFDTDALLSSGVGIVNGKGEIWGLGVVQNIDAASMQLFLSYRNVSADADNVPVRTDLDDVNIVFSGAKITF
ncbi:MAG TPA: porin [Hyphomicrobiaceae bacterium]|nr:porin [Hyphomicrobiaceae bacterium]